MSQSLRLINLRTRAVLADRVRPCHDFLTRLRGLLGTRKLPAGEACWLRPCNAVHTLGMGYPLDLYFLDKKNRVVTVIRNLKPNRFSSLEGRAHSVLEFSAGHNRDCKVGDPLKFEGVR